MNPFNIHLEWARDAPKIKNSKSTLNVIKRQNLVSRQRRNLYLMSKFLEIGLQIKILKKFKAQASIGIQTKPRQAAFTFFKTSEIERRVGV